MYATTVRAAGGDTHVMANYLHVMLTPSIMSWLMSIPPNSIGSWEQLKKVFINNYMATCTRPETRHDLNQIQQKPGKCLRSYIRCFSEMRNSIPNITEAEVITSFIRGLAHKELRSKYTRKPLQGIGEMLTTVNQYADAEEANLCFNDDADPRLLVHPPCHGDERRNEQHREDRRVSNRDHRYDSPRH